MNRRLVLTALAAALALCPAACSSGGTASSGGQSQPAASPSLTGVQKEMAVGKRLAACARTHGHPTFPDPVIDRDGKVTFTAATATEAQGTALKRELAALEGVPACKAIMGELQVLDRRNSAVSAGDIQKLRRLAQCVRQHGVPEFPDPKSDGTIPVTGTPLGGTGKQPAVKAALRACRQYFEGTIGFS